MSHSPRTSIQRRLLVTTGLTFFVSMVVALIVIAFVAQSSLTGVSVVVSSDVDDSVSQLTITSGSVVVDPAAPLPWTTLIWLGSASIAVLVLAAALSAWFISSRAFNRLRNITEVAAALDEDRLHIRFETTAGNDEIDQVASAVNGALDRLQSGFERQKLFVRAAAHELRTPLTVARTALEMPLVEGRVTDDLRPDIDQALAAQARLEEILETLLMLSRGGHAEAVSKVVVLDDAVRRMIAERDPDATVHWSLALDRVSIVTPLRVVELILDNLIHNAVVHNIPAGWVEIVISETNTSAVISIENTGPRMDTDSLAELRQPFTRRPGSPGSGLGLAVVDQIVGWLNGELTITAREHGGLRVDVRLPT